jgi:hypothetical protein
MPLSDYNNAGGIIRKTGSTTLLATSLVVSHLLMMFLFPDGKKKESFYLVRVIISFKNSFSS